MLLPSFDAPALPPLMPVQVSGVDSIRKDRRYKYLAEVGTRGLLIKHQWCYSWCRALRLPQCNGRVAVEGMGGFTYCPQRA